MTLPISQSCPA